MLECEVNMYENAPYIPPRILKPPNNNVQLNSTNIPYKNFHDDGFTQNKEQRQNCTKKEINLDYFLWKYFNGYVSSKCCKIISSICLISVIIIIVCVILWFSFAGAYYKAKDHASSSGKHPLLPIATLEGTCRTSNFKRCLLKEEVGDLADFMQAGDPCFLNDDGKRWCFVSKDGTMMQCSCRYKSCGCYHPSTAIAPPKCHARTSSRNPIVPSDIDACSSKYCQNPYTQKTYNKHTMCEYCGIGKLCGRSICQYGLTEEEKIKIVDQHNKLRSRVALGLESRGVGGIGQPSAANMRKLSWDDELAQISQTWANQCLGDADIFHDKNRRTLKWSHVGQNYASKSHTSNLGDKFIAKMVQDLYDEVQDFPANNIKPFDTKKDVPWDYKENKPKKVGHYTQMVWAETYKIGCGFIMHNRGEWYKKVLVCDYGPGGNYVGGEMYMIGKPGSLCIGAVENGLCL